ncbi:MAG: DUF1264 domain-containing protein, partial [Terriglobales bacterium]
LLLVDLFLCIFVLGFSAGSTYQASPTVAAAAATPQQAPAPAPNPSHGYDVHVTAPHLVDGVEHGPYHHYCKVYTGDPVIVCLIYESTEANAMLSQVEWIYAKKMTRAQVPLRTWNRNWHDHAIEIAGGRVKVHDLPDDKAKEVADLVSTTDGLIYHFYFNGNLPNGKMSIAQAVGHKPMTRAEFSNYEMKK